MIKPTVGRIVNFWHPTMTKIDAQPGVATAPNQPFAAIVTYAWSDVLINLTAFDHEGSPYPFRSVQLLQDDDAAPATGWWASWMDYQKGQAAKTEALERKVAASSP